jgi:hypothetical protein
LPLINDDSNTYGDVVVNPSQLRSAEMRALTASTTKSGGIYLLNKVIEMVFNKEELRVSRGVKGLDQHKLEAIKGMESLFACSPILSPSLSLSLSVLNNHGDASL